MPPAIEPGTMPPMSAWWAMLQTKQRISPSTNTGAAKFMSGRCVPPATCGSLAMNTSPSAMSSGENLSSRELIRPVIEAMWIGSERSA